MADAIPVSSEPKEFPDWVLLDRIGRIHCYDGPDAAAAAVENDPTAVAVDTTSNLSGYFSFTLMPPPKVSYLDLHWPYGMPESPLDLPPLPTVLSADENLLLLRILSQDDYYTHRAPDLFVYTASPSSSPSLRRLPVCDEEMRDLAGRIRFLTTDCCIGILCRGGDQDDYVVADLMVSWKETGPPDACTDASPIIAVLCSFSSRKGEWTAHEMLNTPQDQGPLWYCDRVLPFAGRFLCWVDYYTGILLCDCSDDDSPTLHYAPFPDKEHITDFTRVHRNCPESDRSVSVSQGMMHFICIGSESTGAISQASMTITVWTLKTTDKNFNWEMHRVINLDDLWTKDVYQAQGLPRRPPEFFIVTKNDMDALCCVLREQLSSSKVWRIMLDMKHASLTSSVPYINEHIVCCNEADTEDGNSIFMDIPLLLSDFSKNLNNSPGGP